MSIDSFLKDWTRLAQHPDNLEAVPNVQLPPTTEFMYDWTAINAYCDAHPEVDRSALVAAVRGGFKPVYPMVPQNVGHATTDPGVFPLNVTFDYSQVKEFAAAAGAGRGCGDGVTGD